MKRQKRDRLTRAHSKGHHAGTIGRSSEDCPFSQLDFREEWMSGWRDAREELASGYNF